MTTPDVAAFELAPTDGAPIPAIQPGAHVEFVIERAGQPPLVRHYSLCNRPGESEHLVFGIKREPQSRGGSAWIHELGEGAQVRLGDVRNLFPLKPEARSHLLLAGGIGITPILAMAQALDAAGGNYELHYFVRGDDHVAFRERLADAQAKGRLHVHAGLDGSAVRALLEGLFDTRTDGAHAYCCGPGIFMDTVAEVSAKRWPEDRVHFERFQAAAPTASEGDAPFEVLAKRSGVRCQVGVGQTIIQALSAAGCEVMTSCEQGVCGTCLTQVLEGTPDHRDAYLSKAEREAGKQIMPCVSRSKTALLVLDL
ncbi:PDR/VanB family oxidoreductase [Pelomonas sp. KK5]|uniref:PDR/VanB family oxidoreductase n=1 Tax=Pelomonas sp. KK5 TaxID=1855730 RepID=UPI0013020A01|nr:PDR/VanB family oxidoreductase [Pelomonas sp. KK5]